MEQHDLSVDQARQRVLSALANRWPKASFRVQDDATLFRQYGWVFSLEVDMADRKAELANEPEVPRLALINRTLAQVVSTWYSYSPEQFAKVFESLLAGAGNWCMTMDACLGRNQLSINEAARAAGLEEL